MRALERVPLLLLAMAGAAFPTHSKMTRRGWRHSPATRIWPASAWSTRRVCAPGSAARVAAARICAKAAPLGCVLATRVAYGLRSEWLLIGVGAAAKTRRLSRVPPHPR
jgi:hypothetical protein